MNKITQKVDAPYYNITFKDAMKVLPVMNKLAEFINAKRLSELYLSLDREERENYEWISEPREYALIEDALDAYNTLREIGFESTVELITPTKDMLKRKPSRINLKKNTGTVGVSIV